MEALNKERKVVSVEVLQKRSSTLSRDELTLLLLEYIDSFGAKNFNGKIDLKGLSVNVESILFCDDTKMDGLVMSCGEHFIPRFHLYKLEDSGPDLYEIDEKENDVPGSTQWQLPAMEFHGLWETLIYDSDVKRDLLNFVSTTMLFSERGVNSNIISWNRVVLLHGPPGTGKTSLCKALAQKVAIRLNHRYNQAQLVEINSHSLFSKWFSESGKLVMKMFTTIQELVEDPSVLVIVLIDEVESLARARQSSNSSNEPSDSVRVVNALLTQIDQIKRFPNVLILSTSNISGTIDLAFVDRADIKQFIDLPSPRATCAIYQSCIRELIRANLLEQNDEILESAEFSEITSNTLLIRLWKLSHNSKGLSGRTLRKIPFLAYSLFVNFAAGGVDCFLDAMEQTVRKQFDDRSLMR